MKKILLSIFFAAACIFQASAQSFVDTDIHQRNVVLEGFTGRSCGFCPDAHRIANEIAAAHPGRFWAINLNAGSYSPTSYPNLNTTDGTTIHSGFSVSGYPSGVVNRGTTSSLGRGEWASATNQMLAQNSYVNLGGQVTINPFTRTATITVEAYYTGDSPQSTNFLTVVMLQDSILGSQSDYGNFNPSQWYDEGHTIYIHMNVFRDVVNSTDAWGDPINTTTQGTLVTRTYTYEIPEQIGNPNPVDVDINNIHFLAFIAESQLYVQTAQQLETVIVYENNEFEITAMANPAEGGTIEGAGTYDEGSTCTLTAIANAGYTFINWTKDGTIVSTNPTYSFTVTENASYVANFEAEVGLPGDANGDGAVDALDIVIIVNHIFGEPTEEFVFDNADVNGDGAVDALDIVVIINLIFSK